MIHTRSFIFRVTTASALVLFLALNVSAGFVATVPAPTISGTGLGIVNIAAIGTPTPNNDNVPRAGVQDNNIVVPLKRFDFNGYIDIQFTVTPSGGVTEYQFTEFVDNNTGTLWYGYELLLGYGTGNQFSIGPNPENDGLDFDLPDLDTPPISTAFPTPGPGFIASHNIAFFNTGFHGAGAQQYQFRIDVPDISAPMTFTLRQRPYPVPEPNTTALAILAAISTMWRLKY